MQVASGVTSLALIWTTQNLGLLIANQALDSVFAFYATSSLRGLSSSVLEDGEKPGVYRAQSAAFSVQSIVAPSLGAFLGAASSFSIVYVVDTACALLATLFFLGVKLPAARIQEGVRLPSAGKVRLERSSRTRRAFTVWFAWCVYFGAVAASQVPVANESLGFDTKTVGLWMTFAGIGGASAPLLARVFGRKRVSLWVLIVGHVAALILMSAPVGIAPFVGIFLYGLLFTESVAWSRVVADNAGVSSAQPMAIFWSKYQKVGTLANLTIYAVVAVFFASFADPRLGFALGAIGIALVAGLSRAASLRKGGLETTAD